VQQPARGAACAVGNQDMQRFLRGAAAYGLPVGRADDPLEREADRIADRVMAGHRAGPASRSGPRISRKCAACEAGEPCGRCGTLQREADADEAPAVAPPRVGQVLDAPGRPLDPGVAAAFGERFGRDFSDVRMHDDARANASAGDVHARAYTVGSDIVFARGAYAPGTDDGRRLLAHELAHVSQQADGLRRQPAPGAPAADADQPMGPPEPIKDVELRPWSTVGARVTIGGLQLTEDRGQLDNVTWHLVAHGAPEAMVSPGIDAPAFFAAYVSRNALIMRPIAGTCPEPDDPAYEYRGCPQAEALQRIVEPLWAAAEDTRREARAMLGRFHEHARLNALRMLAASEREANAEAIKYGITATRYIETNYDYTEYEMDERSLGGEGLRNAAKLLVKRRDAINDAWARVQGSMHTTIRVASDTVKTTFDPDYQSNRDRYDERVKEYQAARNIVCSMFPILTAYSDVAESDRDLRKIAEQPLGDELASLLGGKIWEILGNIHDARAGLDPVDDVNVWTLDVVMGLTKAQFGGAQNPALLALVDEKIEDEEPGPLAGIALLVLNIGAILLAPATGGLSLAVAAGVNVGVAAVHVQDYLQQQMLSGTAFDRAKALSSQEPSLFWLAVEIVGAGLDVGAAVSFFRTVGPLAKTAMAAKETKEASHAVGAIRVVAHDAKELELAEQIIAKIGDARRGKAVVIEGFEAESRLLTEVAVEADEIGRPLKTATGELHLGKSGHVFSCASPCTEIGFKYADIFAQDEELRGALEAVRADARRVADLQDAAKMLEADELATKVKTNAAALEKKIHDAYPAARASAEVEAALAESATKLALEDVGHRAARVLTAESIQATRAALSEFPVVAQLSDGAIERILRAGLAHAKGGGLRQATKWASAVRGQLLEELAAVRVRAMLGDPAGRVALGLERDAADLVFVEGSRIRDAEGLQLTDGMIVRRVKDRVEIVAVLESKAGAWSTGKLEAGLKGLKKMPLEELIDGVLEGRVVRKLEALDPRLAGRLNFKALETLDDPARELLHTQIWDAIGRLPEAERTSLKQLMQWGDGQISSDIERLLLADDRTVEILLKDAEGATLKVTAEVPKRPRFLGATPSDVDVTKLPKMGRAAKTGETEDIAAKLRDSGFDFTPLQLDELGMTADGLRKLSARIVKELGGKYEAAANAALAATP
jgi:hypothetical protein